MEQLVSPLHHTTPKCAYVSLCESFKYSPTSMILFYKIILQKLNHKNTLSIKKKGEVKLSIVYKSLSHLVPQFEMNGQNCNFFLTNVSHKDVQ